MIGLRVRTKASHPLKWSSPYMAAKSMSCISLISAPAANALADPVMTAQPCDGSASNARIASSSSDRICAFSALSACGRLSVTSVTASRRSTRMV
ncbi:MAG: hypothetical protein DI632_08245 [Sphingomonas hengshuiensis]|uniref:Uncharacterized protein n=1 Tax=Sphingomonas hengshuiensis TaxID=1609977 RepID=A0A2W4ZCM7_9SPHN|nr:MAG: hypothetical protein DI632_08245 [Sphingomonas hengshuiensis]